MSKLIEWAPVVRDAEGWYRHPDMPEFDEGDGAKYRDWVERQQIKVQRVDMEDDASDEINDRIMDGDIAATADWAPTSPGPDWFLLAIYDTEDGPVAWFASRLPAAQ